MLCKLCGQDERLARSHIIPTSFYKPYYDGSVPLIVSSKPGTYPKRSPTGVYDYIVCEACERLFSPWDDYAYSFLTQQFDPSKYVLDGTERLAYIFEQFDYVKLKLFFLSVLWRASVTNQELFARVELGSHEPVLRTMIRRGNAGEPEEYSVNLFKFDQPVHEVPLLDPMRDKFDGVNFYRLYVYGYTAFIKVDQRKTPPVLQDMILNPEKPLCVIIRAPFNASKEFASMKRALRQTREPLRRWLAKRFPKQHS